MGLCAQDLQEPRGRSQMSFNKTKDTFKATIHFEAYYEDNCNHDWLPNPEGEVDTDLLFITLSGANASPKKPWKFNYSMKKDTLTSFDFTIRVDVMRASFLTSTLNRIRIKHNSNYFSNPSILMESLKRHDYFRLTK